MRILVFVSTILLSVYGALAFAATQIGSTAGEFKVTENGAATYQMPITVPPGIKEHIPQLTLAYSSKQGNGIAGLGWSMQGLSVISRCNSVEGIDSDYRIVDYDDDYYCLDGVRLVAVNGENGVSGTVYHPYNKPLVKVVSHGKQGNGPQSFTVYHGNGSRFFYGITDDSRIEVQSSDDVRVWTLSKAVDKSSNFMLFEYFEDRQHGEYYPLRIAYTGNETASVNPTNHVLLKYENRPDTRYACQAGVLTQSTQRLSSIETYADGEIVKNYKLQYLNKNIPAQPIRVEPNSCDAQANEEAIPEDLQRRYQELTIQIQNELKSHQALLAQYEREIEEVKQNYEHDKSEIEAQIAIIQQEYEQKIADIKANPWEGDEEYLESRALLDSQISQVDEQMQSDLVQRYDDLYAQLLAGRETSADVFNEHQAQNNYSKQDFEKFKSVTAEQLVTNHTNLRQWYLSVAKNYQEKVQGIETKFANLVARHDYWQEYAIEANVEDNSKLIERYVRMTTRSPKQEQLILVWNQYKQQVTKYIRLAELYEEKVESLSFAQDNYANYLEYLGFDSDEYLEVSDQIEQDVEAEYEEILADLLDQETQLEDNYTTEEKGSDRFIDVLSAERDKKLAALYELIGQIEQQHLADVQELEDQLANAKAQYDALMASLENQQVDLQAEIDAKIAELREGYQTVGGKVSRLIAVQECANEFACFEPTYFEWMRRSGIWLTDADYTPPTALISYEKISASGRGVYYDVIGNTPITDAERDEFSDAKIKDILSQLTEQELLTLQNSIAQSGLFVDMDNDGLKDWVVAYYDDETKLSFVGTWLNKNNAWEYAPEYRLPHVHYDSRFGQIGYVADVNYDDLPDQIISFEANEDGVVNTTQKTWVSLGNGLGWTESQQYVLPTIAYRPTDLPVTGAEYEMMSTGQFLDLNQDGYQDWVYSYQDVQGESHSQIYWNTREGWQMADIAFALPGDLYVMQEDVDTQSIDIYKKGTFVDYNGDGLMDWLGVLQDETTQESYVGLWLNSNEGWLEQSDIKIKNQIIQRDVDNQETTLAITPLIDLTQVDLIDIDADGRKDWVRTYKDTDDNILTQILLNQDADWYSDSSFVLPAERYSANGDIKRVWTDINQDGLPDLIRSVENTTTGAVQFDTYINRSQADTVSFEQQETQNPPVPTQIEDDNSSILLGQFVDINNDGYQDWLQILARQNSQYDTAWTHGQAEWTSQANYHLPTLEFSEADFDNYARIDSKILWDEVEQEILLARQAFENNGSVTNNTTSTNSGSTVASGSNTSTDLEKPIQSAQLIDINADGYIDWVKSIRFSSSVQQRVTWLNKGHSGAGYSESSSYRLPAPTISSTGELLSQLSDINADGKADLVMSYLDEEGKEHKRVWMNTGNGWRSSSSFDAPLVFTDLSGNSSPRAQLIDLNSDNLIDWIGIDQGKVVVWWNTGQNWVKGSVTGFPESMLASSSSNGRFIDVNRDGLNDWLEESTGSIWLNPYASVEVIGDSIAETTEVWRIDADLTFPASMENTAGNPVGQFVDINGDGYRDWVSAYTNELGNLQSETLLNTGKGWAISYRYKLPIALYDSNGQRLSTFVDLDKNGYVDVVGSVEENDVLHNRVWLNSGSGLRPAHGYPLPSALAENNGQNVINLGRFADINADGYMDWVQSVQQGDAEPRLATWLSPSRFDGLIDSITNGLGIETRITYARGLDRNVYIPDQNSPFPSVDVVSPGILVKSIRVDNGINDERGLDFKYGGYKLPVNRYGSRGMRWYTVTDISRRQNTYTEFYQESLFAGQVRLEESRLASGLVLKRNEYTLDIGSKYNDKLRENVFISQLNEKLFDARGRQNRETIYRWDVDEFGLRIRSQQEVDDGIDSYYEDKHLTYEHRINSWQLGLLVTEKLTRTLNGKSRPTQVSTYTYDAQGLRLSSQVAPENNQSITESKKYDVFGNATETRMSVPGESDRVESREFDPTGRFVSKSRDIFGRETQFIYDARHGEVIKQILPDGQAIRRTYNAFGFKRTEHLPNGARYSWAFERCTSACPEEASYMLLTLDNDGNAPQVEYLDSVQRAVKRTTIGFNGQPMSIETKYDAFGREIATSRPYADNTFIENADFTNNGTSSEKYWTTYQYDGFDRKIKETNPAGESQSYVYSGNIVTVIDPLGRKTVTRNDFRGNKAWIRDALGNYTSYIYDADNNLVEIIDAHGNKTQIEYDVFGRKTRMLDPDVGVTTYTYNGFGQLISETDELGQEYRIVYDKFGRRVERHEPEGVTKWEYGDDESMGASPDKVKKVTGPNGYVENLVYDKEGRVIRHTKKFKDSKPKSIEYDYYGSGDLIATIKYPSGFSLRYSYDSQGNVNEILNAGLLEFEAYKKAFDKAKSLYDDAQPYIEEAEQIRTFVEARKKEAEALWKQGKAVQRRIDSYVARAKSYGRQAESYGRKANEYGRKLEQALREAFAYKERLVNEQYEVRCERRWGWVKEPGGQRGDGNYQWYDHCVRVEDLSYEKVDQLFDRAENMRRKAEHNASLARRYGGYAQREANNANRLVPEAERIFSRYSDKVELINSKTEEANGLIGQANALLDRSEVWHENAKKYYDAHVAKTKESFWKAEQLGLESGVLKWRLGNGLITEHIVDPKSGRLQTIQTGTESQSDAVQKLDFEYDAAGNVIRRQDQHLGYDEKFLYDSLDRLVLYTHNDNLANLVSYDAIGNIRHKSDAGAYSYAGVDADGTRVGPHAVTQVGESEYRYDAVGNIISGGGKTISYSSFRKPIRLQDENSDVNLIYGPDRSRIYQQSITTNEETGTESTETWYFFKGEYEEEISGDVMKRRHVITHAGSAIAVLTDEKTVDEKWNSYLDAIIASDCRDTDEEATCYIVDGEDVPDDFAVGVRDQAGIEDFHIKLVDGQTIQFIHTDHLGSTTVITNEQATVLSRSNYDPFGNPRYVAPINPDTGLPQEDPTDLDIPDADDSGTSFSGHEMLAVGLTHMNGRVYNGNIGRFLTADPYIPDLYNPQNLNRYSYVLNNPLAYTDPSGFTQIGVGFLGKQRHRYDVLRYFNYRHFQFVTRSHLSFQVFINASTDIFGTGAVDPNAIARIDPSAANRGEDVARGLSLLAANGVTIEMLNAGAIDILKEGQTYHVAYEQYKKEQKWGKWDFVARVAAAVIDIYVPGLGTALYTAAKTYTLTGDLDQAILNGAVAFVSYRYLPSEGGLLQANIQEHFVNALVHGAFAELTGGEFEDGFRDYFINEGIRTVVKKISSNIQGDSGLNITLNGENIDVGNIIARQIVSTVVGGLVAHVRGEKYVNAWRENAIGNFASGIISGVGADYKRQRANALRASEKLGDNSENSKLVYRENGEEHVAEDNEHTRQLISDVREQLGLSEDTPIEITINADPNEPQLINVYWAPSERDPNFDQNVDTEALGEALADTALFFGDMLGVTDAVYCVQGDLGACGDAVVTIGINVVTGGGAVIAVKIGYRFFKLPSRQVLNHLDAVADSPFPNNSVGAAGVWSVKGRIKAAQLPNQGKIRFVPPKNYNPSQPFNRGPNHGFIDKFGNEWVRGPSRTKGEPFEWDVQLSNTGRDMLGHLSRDGKHINVSLGGKITH